MLCLEIAAAAICLVKLFRSNVRRRTCLANFIQEKMVKRCCYGTCNSDTRYPDRLEGGLQFVPFPKPKTELEKCLRWIKLCGRPHSQLNVKNIGAGRYVCTKHFVNKSWPTQQYPDPLPATELITSPKSARPSPSKRRRISQTKSLVPDGQSTQGDVQTHLSMDKESQTTSQWVDPSELLTVAAENETLKRDLAKESTLHIETERKLSQREDDVQVLKDRFDTLSKCTQFTVDAVKNDEKLIMYYTGFSKETFDAIFKFLVPDDRTVPLKYTQKLSITNTMLLQDQLFLTLCKLRNNLDFQDLGCRFGISQQCASVIFTSWINYMFLRLGEVSIWPHRDVLTANMPEKFKLDFPTTFAILDCTEIKIQKPSSLKTQSQTYSEYKSSNTLKALVACDPRGSVIFSSMLFSGAMSDREIFIKSKLKETLQNLIEIGYLKDGDGMMGDKGFNIESEVESVGLKLNIPPFAHSGKQMNQHDALYTKKIAMHRVHVERAIRRIKSFKILSGKISLSMMSNINQIWYVCSFLTNFMPPCIKGK